MCLWLLEPTSQVPPLTRRQSRKREVCGVDRGLGRGLQVESSGWASSQDSPLSSDGEPPTPTDRGGPVLHAVPAGWCWAGGPDGGTQPGERGRGGHYAKLGKSPDISKVSLPVKGKSVGKQPQLGLRAQGSSGKGRGGRPFFNRAGIISSRKQKAKRSLK